MKPPPLMLGAAAIFWGWQTGLWIPALICALAVESSALTLTRIAFQPREYGMIWSLSALIFLSVSAYLLSIGEGPAAFFTVAKWLPLIFLPVAAAQAFGSAERIPLSAFSLLFRNSKGGGPGDEAPAVNLGYPYFVMFLCAASAANQREVWFYVGVGALSMAALWGIRPKSYSVRLWAGSFILVLLTGYAAGAGLHRLQAIVEDSLVNFYARMFLNQPDPFTTNTSIGEVGSLKASGVIQFRVESSGGYSSPVYLPMAGYNTYRAGAWFAMKSSLSPVFAEKNGLSWRLAEPMGAGSQLSVAAFLHIGEGLLLAPINAYELDRLPALKMFVNQMGAIKVGGAPDYVRYTIKLGQDSLRISRPDENDLKVPPEEDEAITRAAEELGVLGMDAGSVPPILEKYFQENFRYSLDLSSPPGANPMEDFLFRSRSGHCEYFATAAVLLLRKAGVPARYFVGYLAGEYSSLENAFIVRSRDAHAWAMAYIDGKWTLLDATPASWREQDSKNGDRLEKLHDLFSYIYLQFSRWRWGEISLMSVNALAALLAPLFLLLIWRIMSTTKLSRQKEAQENPSQDSLKPGAASAFYLVEKRLNELGFVREPWETEAEFIRRTALAKAELEGEKVMALLDLHYRLRFDPQGLSGAQLEEMMDITSEWIERTQTAPKDGQSAGKDADL